MLLGSAAALSPFSTLRGLPRFFGMAESLLVDPGAGFFLAVPRAEALRPEGVAALPFLAAFLAALAASSSIASSKVMSRGSSSYSDKCFQRMHRTQGVRSINLCHHLCIKISRAYMSSSYLGTNLDGAQLLRASNTDSGEQAHLWQRGIERLVADVGPVGAHRRRDRLAVIRMPAQLLRRHLVLAQQT